MTGQLWDESGNFVPNRVLLRTSTLFLLFVNIDNAQAKGFTEHSCINARLRNTFNLDQQWMKEVRDSKLLKVNKIESINDPADSLTKPQPACELKQLLKLCDPLARRFGMLELGL